VVHDADKLELLHQALRYEQSGTRGLDEFWDGHTWHFPASAALAERLFAGRGKRT
jgi:5'-deoxynucleotidase YfbR-like HD superfamily hydrolase